MRGFPRDLIIVLALGLSSAGCRSAPPQDSTREYGAGLRMSEGLGLDGLVAVRGTVWLAGIPSAADLDLAHRRGVATLLDVSTDDELTGIDLGTACRKLSITYVGVHPAEKDHIGDELVDRVLGELERFSHQPLLFVSANANRTAMLYAIERVVHEGAALEGALIEARKGGMKPGHPEVFVRKQVERLSGARH